MRQNIRCCTLNASFTSLLFVMVRVAFGAWAGSLSVKPRSCSGLSRIISALMVKDSKHRSKTGATRFFFFDTVGLLGLLGLLGWLWLLGILVLFFWF